MSGAKAKDGYRYGEKAALLSVLHLTYSVNAKDGYRYGQKAALLSS